MSDKASKLVPPWQRKKTQRKAVAKTDASGHVPMQTKSRPVFHDGETFTTVFNKRPGYKYCLALRADQMFGLESKLMLGWEPVLHGDQERLGGAKGERGDHQVFMDHVLLRLPIEQHMHQWREGGLGGRGQNYHDWLDQKLVEKGGIDPLRGMHGIKPGSFGVENDTKAPELETEV